MSVCLRTSGQPNAIPDHHFYRECGFADSSPLERKRQAQCLFLRSRETHAEQSAQLTDGFRNRMNR